MPPGTAGILGPNPIRRAADVFQMKLSLARNYLQRRVPEPINNGDEGRYQDYRAMFAKTLPHDAQGNVDRAAYRSLLSALERGTTAAFDAVILDGTVRTRTLANPQAAYRMPPRGPDGQIARMPAAPAFAGLETAAEMLEVYWKAQLRDVPFAAFADAPLVARAVAELNDFPVVIGRPPAGRHTARTVFRGETDGDRTGPYLSQFLWQDIPFGPATHQQRYRVPVASDFMTSFPEWLAVQRGGVPGRKALGPDRYIFDGRSLAGYVHTDFPYQPYMNAALIMLGWGPDYLARGNPLRGAGTQGGFVTFGGPDVLDVVSAAANMALSGAWYQKWLVHRRLRPEAYGGRLDRQLAGAADFGLPEQLGATEALDRTRARTGTYLLPLAYPEGSPTHPAYPAGHATVAGACATVLKAFFDEDALVPNPVEADRLGQSLRSISADLTLSGEINKLAANISLGRDWAGVHYRSDGIAGMALGEAMAIDLLREHSRCYAEAFDGFTLTRFDGRRIVICEGEVA
jgi:membrane-associated phospholipid phosphatase